MAWASGHLAGNARQVTAILTCNAVISLYNLERQKPCQTHTHQEPVHDVWKSSTGARCGIAQGFSRKDCRRDELIYEADAFRHTGGRQEYYPFMTDCLQQLCAKEDLFYQRACLLAYENDVR